MEKTLTITITESEIEMLNLAMLTADTETIAIISECHGAEDGALSIREAIHEDVYGHRVWYAVQSADDIMYDRYDYGAHYLPDALDMLNSIRETTGDAYAICVCTETADGVVNYVIGYLDTEGAADVIAAAKG